MRGARGSTASPAATRCTRSRSGSRGRARWCWPWLRWALLRDRRQRWPVLGLLAVVGVSGGTVYGLLSPVMGRAPMLDVSNNIRFLTVLCFGVAAMAGLGLDRLLAREPRRDRSGPLSQGLLACGVGLAVAGLGLAVAAVVFREDELRDLLPEIDGRIGFWVATGVLAVVAGGRVLRRPPHRHRPDAPIAGRLRGRGPAGGGALRLALQPPGAPSQSPPASSTIDWLRANVGEGSVAAAGLELIPNVASGLPPARPPGRGHPPQPPPPLLLDRRRPRLRRQLPLHRVQPARRPLAGGGRRDPLPHAPATASCPGPSPSSRVPAPPWPRSRAPAPSSSPPPRRWPWPTRTRR